MALCPPDWPGCARARRSRAATLIVDSVDEARGLVGYLEFGGGDECRLVRRRRRAASRGRSRRARTPAPAATATGGQRRRRRSSSSRIHRRSVPAGELRLRALRLPRRAAARRPGSGRSIVGWDVVPVVIQDPVWEQSFPQLDGIVVAARRRRRPHAARAAARAASRRAGARGTSERRATRCSTGSQRWGSSRCSSRRPSREQVFDVVPRLGGRAAGVERSGAGDETRCSIAVAGSRPS